MYNMGEHNDMYAVFVNCLLIYIIKRLRCTLDLSVEHKLSLSLDMDPLTTYQVKVCILYYTV